MLEKNINRLATFPINGGFSGKITYTLEELPLPCLITGRSLTTGGFVLEKIC